MIIFFCCHEGDIHPLLLEEWRTEVIDGHTNHDDHRVVARVPIEEEELKQAILTYVKTVVDAGGDANTFLQGVIQLGFEAGQEGYESGLILNDLIHLVTQDDEGDVHLNVLIALHKIGFEQGIQFKPPGS